MLIDARQLPTDAVLETDICIVGAGAAGLAIALELDGAGIEAMLVESGGFREDAITQSLYEGTSDDAGYSLSAHRTRCFGGTTNQWSGLCAPMDESDFQERPWLQHSGWPFDRRQLLPYYQRAQTRCGLPSLELYDPGRFSDGARTGPLEMGVGGVTTAMLHVASKLRFGRAFRRAMLRSKNVTLVLHSNVTELVTNEAGRSVTYANGVCLSGRSFTVRARRYVLATGGIENARLLLASNRTDSHGLGNQHDLVGRYFMERLYPACGVLHPAIPHQRLSFYTDQMRLGRGRGFGILRLSEAVRAEHRLLGLNLHLHRMHPAETAPSVEACKDLRATLSSRRWPESPITMMGDIATGMVPLARVLAWRSLLRASIDTRRPPLVYLVAGTEPEPHPENRVLLSSERDALGQPRVHLRHRLSESYWDSITRTMRIVEQELRRAGVGQVLQGREEDRCRSYRTKYGSHHMGATRMHDDPRKGVVDRDCRVHGVSNLYVAGSSVFPTAGSANPTLTIIALAIRLADQLRAQAGNGFRPTPFSW